MRRHKTLLERIILWSLCAVLFVGYVLAVAFFLRYMSERIALSEVSYPVVTPPEKAPGAVPPTTGVPAKLVIPNLTVSAGVASVGIKSDGTMDIDKSLDNVAWYNLGPRPGNVGSAVIAGHYGWENGKPAVFNNLHTLKKGDIISVNDEKGAVISFVVRESRSYDPNADATAIFRSNDGKSHLNIITCEGVWDSSKQSYSDRLVVFTDKI